MQPIVYQKDNNNTRIIVRAWSSRITLVNLKNYDVLREIDFADHDVAMFFAKKLARNVIKI